MAQAFRLTPEDHLKILERSAVDGDLSTMMKNIGELHLRWNSLTPSLQTDVKRMEGVFLTLLQARTAGARA
ncbi:MAG TPA: hypothetical protein VEF76_08530 [Patescibacteria group bacterium]|nr:hypothetical protein [Patescibacteria group bacterium]